MIVQGLAMSRIVQVSPLQTGGWLLVAAHRQLCLEHIDFGEIGHVYYLKSRDGFLYLSARVKFRFKFRSETKTKKKPIRSIAKIWSCCAPAWPLFAPCLDVVANDSLIFNYNCNTLAKTASIAAMTRRRLYGLE
jgi:hypothetical protein